MSGEDDDRDSSDDKGAAGEVQQQLAEAQQKLGASEQENKTLKDAKGDLEQRLDDADKELLSEDFLTFKEGKEKGGKGASSTEGGGGLDLDRASNREIAEFIEGKYKGDIDAAVKDIKSSIDSNKQQIGMIAAQFDVALTTLRHDGKDGKPSFAENQKEIFEVAKKNPKWSAEECYKQFAIQSKVAADEIEAAKKKKAEEDEKSITEKADGVPDSAITDKEVTAEQAAEIAYKQAFGNKE